MKPWLKSQMHWIFAWIAASILLAISFELAQWSISGLFSPRDIIGATLLMAFWSLWCFLFAKVGVDTVQKWRSSSWSKKASLGVQFILTLLIALASVASMSQHAYFIFRSELARQIGEDLHPREIWLNSE